MPGDSTCFNSDWLSFKDFSNVISFWWKKKDNFTAFCSL